MDTVGTGPNKLLGPGMVLGLSLIVSASICAFTFYQVRQMDDTLSVTGSAKMQVRADAVRWTGSFQRNASLEELSPAYGLMRQDETNLVQFFVSHGMPAEAVSISPVMLEEPYRYGPEVAPEYVLRQNFEFRSSDVDAVTALAKDVRWLAERGLVFSPAPLEYTYTQLPQARIDLLSDAIGDAQARAESIADSTGRRVGTLTSASMGVVQVLPVNSTDISDWGTYDTSSVDKEVMVTVKASFVLK
ncbi:MAG: SIMPL domain-containing protein [bacterium]